MARVTDPMDTLYFDKLSKMHQTGVIRTMEAIKRCQKENIDIVIYKLPNKICERGKTKELMRIKNDRVNQRVIVNGQYEVPYLPEDYNPKIALKGAMMPNTGFNMCAILYGMAPCNYRVEIINKSNKDDL